MAPCSMWRPGRNIRDVRASMTRNQRADIRCRRGEHPRCVSPPLGRATHGSVGPIAPLRATPAGWCGPTSPGRPLGRAALRESRLGRRYRRPGPCRTPAPLQPTQAPIEPNRDTAQDAINRGTTTVSRRRRQLHLSHLSHAATGAVGRDSCLKNPPVRSRRTPCTRNRIDFGKQDSGPKRGVNAGLVQMKQVRPGT